MCEKYDFLIELLNRSHQVLVKPSLSEFQRMRYCIMRTIWEIPFHLFMPNYDIIED